MLRPWPLIALFAIACSGAGSSPPPAPAPASSTIGAGVPFAASPDEPRLSNLRMLTNGGENAEAYFSEDDTRLIFQAHRPPETQCDQIYTLDLMTGEERRITPGGSRNTCAYFYPHRDRVVFASTAAMGDTCPTPPSMRQGYVWALYDYDIYTANRDGSDRRVLYRSPAYDAEATISNDGSRIVFTSASDGDLDIYVMDADGGNVKRLTNELGYDGGPFFSADGTQIVYRAHHPTDPKEIEDYQNLLRQGLIRPGRLDVYVMNADGTNKRRVTNFNAASFAPFFHPNGRQIIFSSNMDDPRGRNFDLYLINVDGTGLERITTHGEFDGFPMFSKDGTKLVFGSNRGAAKAGETNVFIADWKP
jgi:Tol biopolymer transport system component